MRGGGSEEKTAGEGGVLGDGHDFCLQTLEGPSRDRETRLVRCSAWGKTGKNEGGVKEGQSQGTSLDTRVPSMTWEVFSTEERALGSRSRP